MNEYQNLPESYEANTQEIVALLILLWTLLLKALLKLLRLPATPTATNLNTLGRQVDREVTTIIRDIEVKTVRLATNKVTEAYAEGVRYARLSLSQNSRLNEIKKLDTKEIIESLDDSHTRRLNQLRTQSQEDLLKATSNTSENVKRLIRQVVSREISQIGISGRIGKITNVQKRVENQIREQFLKNGIKDADVAIIDKAGRRWKLRTYAEMAVRTKMNDAYIEAIREESLQDGSDLAIISTKPGTEDECLNYEGMIISLNGLTAGFLTYEEIKRSKKCFHPNCGHFVRPIGGIEWVPAQAMIVHERQMRRYRRDLR